MSGADDLGLHIERVARGLFGEANRALSKGDELRFGTNGSMAIKIAGPKGGTWYDHERQLGGGVLDLLRDCGIDPATYLDDPKDSGAGQHVVARYGYRAEDGRLLFEVLRWGPKKTFTQQQPGAGKGGIKRGADGKPTIEGARRVPYRLPELVAARRNRNGHPPRIYIVEGEKDADRLALWGLVATTNAGGAGKWRDEFSPHLAGCDVVILADNDAAGHAHAKQVARSVAPHAESVRLITLTGLEPKGDISDWIDAGGTEAVLDDIVDATASEARMRSTDAPFADAYDGEVIKNADGEPIICEQLEPLPIDLIPPRTWAYGHFLLFGCASVLAAVDGGGKGAQAVAIALSMITGRDLLGERVWRTGPVVIVTYEDDKMEWRRRIAAACLFHDIDYDTVIGSFHFISRPRAQITFAARLTSPRGDSKIGFPDSAAVIAHLQRLKPALLIVDPFNRAHALEDGNSNVMISLVAGEIGRVVAAAACAGLVLHHLRKGASGEADDVMGATALRSTFRATRILMRMTKEEAEGFRIPPAEAYRYSRIAATKENYTKPERARWYVLESVELGNTGVDRTYPEGDSIQAIATWPPPDAFEGLGRSAIAEIFAAFRAGTGDGEFYSTHGSATHKAKDPIVRHGKTADEARRILNAWKDTGVISTDDTYLSPTKRRRKPRVTLNEAKARDILGPLYQPPEARP